MSAGDIQGSQPGAAKGARGHPLDWQLDAPHFLPLGRVVAHDGPALPNGDPEIAVLVNGHAVWDALLGRDLDDLHRRRGHRWVTAVPVRQAQRGLCYKLQLPNKLHSQTRERGCE